MTAPSASPPAAAGAGLSGSRWPRVVAAVLFGMEALLLLGGVPIVLLMILGSAWEGGDQEFKHRVLAWGPLSLPIVLVAVGLAFAAASVVGAAKPAAMALSLGTAGAVVVLAAGWAWVWRQDLLHDGTVLGFWLLETGPAVVGAALICALPSPRRTTAADEPSVGVER